MSSIGPNSAPRSLAPSAPLAGSAPGAKRPFTAPSVTPRPRPEPPARKR
jgi:hypothetical protein